MYEPFFFYLCLVTDFRDGFMFFVCVFDLVCVFDFVFDLVFVV